jgi:hypothetical protein
VELQPLSLSGGISSVDVLADHIIPAATDLSYAVMVNSNWMPLAGDPDHPKPLGAANNLLRFKVIFTGTTDLMPGVSLQNSQVKLVGPPVADFYHISTNIPRGSATATGLQIVATATNFNSHHTLTCNVHWSGGRLNPSITSPPVTLTDGVTTQFVWQFSQATISNYQVEMTGHTDGTGDNFVVSQRAAYGK